MPMKYAMLAVLAAGAAIFFFSQPFAVNPYADELAEARRVADTKIVTSPGEVHDQLLGQIIAAHEKVKELEAKTSEANHWMAMLSNALSVLSSVMSAAFAWMGYRLQRGQSVK